VAKWKDAESTKVLIMQVDDLLTFRQFSKKSEDDTIEVCDLLTNSEKLGMKILTDFFHKMMRTLEGRLGGLRFAKILYPILVIF